MAQAAFTYAEGGYLTVVDGIVGPWMLAQTACAVHAAVGSGRYVLGPSDHAGPPGA
ncbi:hypothetical protein [Cellulomonas uda]|uniref:Uncharacterized protein n=1 Tax=Cellulomonas uda TaxID=1714 RepID=A0A4Y3K9E0_CELUD|nr:hypothetical protein [Cellulomonas uda]NII65407.1 hypothetical protein [Cellulomonas uda]GEA80582.1 hypothetical protein CUD01_10260 [Cellulomonas uda]